MINRLLTSIGRRPQVRTAAGLVDRRSGAPVRRGPEPMPRMRWYG